MPLQSSHNTAYEIYGFLSTFGNDLSSKLLRIEVRKDGYFQSARYYMLLFGLDAHSNNENIAACLRTVYVTRQGLFRF